MAGNINIRSRDRLTQKQIMNLIQALEITEGNTLSAVGGGGKTSLIFALAGELAHGGGCVLVTTTTAFLHPKCGDFSYHRVVIGDMDPHIGGDALSAGRVVVAAQQRIQPFDKLKGYPPEYIDAWQAGSWFGFILVEADGAKRRPVKAPAAHEPVVPHCTAITVGVIGLDALDKPLTPAFAHRPELMAKVTGLDPGRPITEQTLLSLIGSPQGLFNKVSAQCRKVVLLNKADNAPLLKRGKALAQRIMAQCSWVDRVLVACLRDDDPVKVVVGPA